MDNELKEEIGYEIQLLLKMGFYSDEEILEIIDDQFIEENISEEKFLKIFNEYKKDFKHFNSDSEDISNLKNSFEILTRDFNILSIHNAGYDIEEGIQDSFELYTHLKNNDFEVEGFCFYSFEDIEDLFDTGNLNIAFGDFLNDEDKALKIGEIIAEVFNSNNLKLKWNKTVDDRIELTNFIWEKSLEKREYSMDGALEDFIRLNSKEKNE